MKHFGTVRTFDGLTGIGSIRPEEGGRDLSFTGHAIIKRGEAAPVTGVRLSYHLGLSKGLACAIDLHSVLPRKNKARLESFSVFRTAAEEAMLQSDLAQWDEEGGQQLVPSEPTVTIVPPSVEDLQLTSEGRRTIDHTFIADGQHVIIPFLLTLFVGGIAATIAFLP